ncbi:MAG: efflux RND transporter permease subunit [Candidatus Binataceae bacterium]
MPQFSLRQPHIIIVAALLIAILGVLAFAQMPVDVFPRLYIKAAVVATFYPGFAPLAMEQDITSRYERFFTLGNGIEHIESRSIPGVSAITVYFHSDVDIGVGAANLATLAMGDLGLMPPGTLPPLVLEYNASSSIPVILVTVSGPYSETELQNEARYNVRNFMATIEGAAVPYPFGGKIRQIMAYVDRQKLQAQGITLEDAVNAINATNQILPSGDAKIGPYDWYIYSNGQIPSPEALNQVPIKIGPSQAPTYFGDIGNVQKASAIQYNQVLIDGKPSVYIPILKQTGANTLAVINGIEHATQQVTGLPSNMKVGTLFSQAGTILDAVHALEHEAMSGALLASLMILIFLGSYRSTFAIFLSIPLSILAGLVGLSLSHQTINLMTLGGFTLAIGRLVDDSTVVLENINRHLAMGKKPAQAADEGAGEVTYAVLASTISTIVVFLPVIFLFGVSKRLFSALALAVFFSMAASYIVSMSIIPIYCARLLDPEEARQAAERERTGVDNRRGLLAAFDRSYERFSKRFAVLLDRTMNHKFLLIGGAFVLFVASMFVFPQLGTRMFPETDSGKFIINIVTPIGSRLELTSAAAKQITAIIQREVPARDLENVIANLGVVPNISALYTPNSGEDTGQIMVALRSGHKRPTAYYQQAVRSALIREMPNVKTFFSSGSIIDAVLDFGALAPIDVQLSAPLREDYAPMFDTAREIEARLSSVPEVGQLMIKQVASYPTLNINVDRTKAARLGITERSVITNLITALNSNALVKPSIWIDPRNGDDYYLSAQYFEEHINSLHTLLDIPVGTRLGAEYHDYTYTADRSPGNAASGHEQSILLGDVATVRPSRYPSEADHYNIQRVVDVLISPRTSDLGGTLDAVKRALKNFRPPRDVKIYYHGSVVNMQRTFKSMEGGFLLAIVVVYLVGVAQSSSWLDPLIFLFSVPMGLIGVAWMLWATHTTINVESMMGVIVMIGIVVSNAILLIDFANERRLAGHNLREAAVEAARIRMRPILMTSLATVAGLAPLAMTLEAGSAASAPLARSVIGGLTVSLVMTLFLVPSLWELFYSLKQKAAASPKEGNSQ